MEIFDVVRYETAKEYLEDENITNENQIAWSTLETEELSNGCSAYDMTDFVSEYDPRDFILERRQHGLTIEDAIKVMNLALLYRKFGE